MGRRSASSCAGSSLRSASTKPSTRAAHLCSQGGTLSCALPSALDLSPNACARSQRSVVCAASYYDCGPSCLCAAAARLWLTARSQLEWAPVQPRDATSWHMPPACRQGAVGARPCNGCIRRPGFPFGGRPLTWPAAMLAQQLERALWVVGETTARSAVLSPRRISQHPPAAGRGPPL